MPNSRYYLHTMFQKVQKYEYKLIKFNTNWPLWECVCSVFVHIVSEKEMRRVGMRVAQTARADGES